MPPRVIDHLDRFILLPDAARQLNLSEVKLRTLIKNGKIRAAILPSGEVGVNEQDAQAQKPVTKEDLPEYKKYAHLKGEEIGLSEAAKKYHIPSGTLTRWMKAIRNHRPFLFQSTISLGFSWLTPLCKSKCAV